jgi:cell division protein FtsL
LGYTFIVLNTDRTDKGSKTFSMSRTVLYFLMALVLFAPSITYYLAYYVMAPNYLVKEAKVYKEELDTLKEDHQELQYENESLKIDNEVLKVEGITAREELDEISTRIEMTEKARSTTSDRVQALEEDKLDLERRLSFYEKFIKPDVDEEILQCFNISVRQDGDKLKYGINFLKTDQNNKTEFKTIVKMKVLYGSNILNLNEDKSYEADREVRMNITKDRRLTGSIVADVPEGGLHILDIKAYSEDNRIIAHCWKPF